ncbi:hypothetical protein IMG5_194730 [Ichthyophthirius multifiliis]|uniref:Uncharacterized protein n=1 Tax=Ichthyophthirius multifiliis TaxID=5932 RepID=G0R4T6_ICHMU|nr:hypothetical protein IMG5_194730 [Ichthyophthirius multifiliis]EGR27524.1 hypothetical protein IMG5_194730 [Ichthyophthirius multifiliis]|eukprot:XP_004024976.1 hypothetical protein IMG5_194730 [Ichthyophthirius multifiliis]
MQNNFFILIYLYFIYNYIFNRKKLFIKIYLFYYIKNIYLYFLIQIIDLQLFIFNFLILSVIFIQNIFFLILKQCQKNTKTLIIQRVLLVLYKELKKYIKLKILRLQQNIQFQFKIETETLKAQKFYIPQKTQNEKDKKKGKIKYFIKQQKLLQILGETTGFGNIKIESSAKDCVQRANELEQILIEQKKQNKRLIDELESRKERFKKREVEYRKIICELQDEIKNKAVPNTNEQKRQEEIQQLHSQIVENIDNIQVKTSKIILDQEKDVLRFFNNKINEIKKQFEEERIKKSKKDQDYVEKELKLTSKLEWIKNIAQKIDNENHNLMKKYMDLKSQYQTQENDREMLLKELIMKKKKYAILKSQLEQYEQLLNEASKEIEHADEDSLKKNSQSNNGIYSFYKLYILKYNLKINKMILIILISQQEKTFKVIQSSLRKEQKRVKDLKQLYLKEIEQKNELNRIISKYVENIKQDFKQKHKSKDNNSTFTQEMRQKLIEQILSNDTILTLVYDKTFCPDLKDLKINENEEEYENQSFT